MIARFMSFYKPGVTPDLSLEAFLDGLLVGSTCIIEAERHGVVAVCPKGRDEGGCKDHRGV